MKPFRSISLQHPIAPFERSLALALRIVTARRLGQNGEIRHLVDGELIDVLVVIGACCRLHAIGVPAEEDLIKIKFEDLRLRQNILDAAG
jgi:hypothetical protein